MATKTVDLPKEEKTRKEKTKKEVSDFFIAKGNKKSDVDRKLLKGIKKGVISIHSVTEKEYIEAGGKI